MVKKNHPRRIGGGGDPGSLPGAVGNGGGSRSDNCKCEAHDEDYEGPDIELRGERVPPPHPQRVDDENRRRNEEVDSGVLSKKVNISPYSENHDCYWNKVEIQCQRRRQHVAPLFRIELSQLSSAGHCALSVKCCQLFKYCATLVVWSTSNTLRTSFWSIWR